MVCSWLILPCKACCAVLRVSGAFLRAQQTLLVTLLATYKPLYTPGKTLLILYHKPRFHLCTWLYTDSETFHAQLNELYRHTQKSASRHRHKQLAHTYTHIHAHTLSRVLFLQAVASLILSDLKFVCSSLQRAPSMIPGSLRAPPSTIIPPLSFPSLLFLRLSRGWSSGQITPYTLVPIKSPSTDHDQELKFKKTQLQKTTTIAL